MQLGTVHQRDRFHDLPQVGAGTLGWSAVYGLSGGWWVVSTCTVAIVTRRSFV